MKTTKNTFWKVLGMVAIALSLVSCGKDNNSGGSSSNGDLFNLPGVGNVNSVLPCPGNVGRTTYQYQLTGGTPTPGQAIGVTCIGDTVVKSGNNITISSCNTIYNQPAQPYFHQGMQGTVKPYMAANGQTALGIIMPISFPQRGYNGGAFNPPSQQNLQMCQQLRSQWTMYGQNGF